MIKIFADGADLAAMRALAEDERIAGFTTNPSLLRKAGVQDYRAFALEALAVAVGKPVSLEVFADEFDEMESQAQLIASWGSNAVVKIPVTNTRGESSAPLIRSLAMVGVPLNVTAIFTVDQVVELDRALSGAAAFAIASVFAGRIADAGVGPLEHVARCRRVAGPRISMLWASPRQVYDVVLAERAGCDIITMTPDLIAKMVFFGRDLTEYSRETVEMFYRDAQEAGYAL